MTRPTPEERLLATIEYDTNGGCWLWSGTQNRKAYGRFKHGPCRVAHRVSWVLFRGPIPDGLCVCHRRDTPACVRPDHLFLGTHPDNARDRTRKGRTSVPVGEAQWASKLRAEHIPTIRRRIAAGERLLSIARDFGVTKPTICAVGKGLSWKHVPQNTGA